MDEKIESASDGPSSDGPSAARQSSLFALTPRVYALLALLLLTYALPPLLHRIKPVLAHPHHATAEGELSDQDFGRYVSAETNVRLGICLRDTSWGSALPTRPSPRSAAVTTRHDAQIDGGRNVETTVETATVHTHAKTEKPAADPISRIKDFEGAIADYRALSRTTHAPNMDRRVLILNHAAGKPFDENTLRTLTANLKLAKTTDSDIAAETALWRVLYAPKLDQATLPASLAAEAETRLRAMKLRLLQDRVLADLYDCAGNPTARQAAKARLDTVAKNSLLKAAFQQTVSFVAGLAGFVLLIFFVVSANGQNWPQVRRVATANTRLRWGTLIECFLFYLAFYRFLGFIVGMLLTASDWHPDPHQALFLSAGLQIGTGAIAVLYAQWQARRNDTDLGSIGLTARGNPFGNIGYGILGYCATLPLVLVASLASRAIFRHDTNTTPNPVLPLMVGTHDPLSRALIFLMASVAAPFFEELFFRGVLFTALRVRWGWVASAAISGLCFALVHPMQDWLPIFVMGFTFATMREMRQSLIPGMTAHFLQNTLSFLLLSSLFST